MERYLLAQQTLRMLTTISLLTLTALGCRGDGSDGGSASLENADRSLQGGDTTTDDRTPLSFENPSANLNDEQNELHLVGDANFGAQFVTAPSTINPGLGPIFNNNACDACHTSNGRGQPVFSDPLLGSQALLRISQLGGVPEAPGGPGAVGGLGTQLQDHAVFGVSSEGAVSLDYEEVKGEYGDGTSFVLRKPVISVRLADGIRLPASIMTSVRIAPPVFGLGLLEAVSEADITSRVDASDLDGDGISGRANYVYNPISNSQKLGRFGLKANNSSLLVQVAAAYINDMGVTNPIFTGGEVKTEIDSDILTSVEFYTQTLAVPRAANITDPLVIEGEKHFKQFACSSCHVAPLRTADHPVSALRNQVIFPYTDMLLHDMGAGLADGRPDFLADGNEWRTTPLWGIGIAETILGSNVNFLHDGRARTIEEAILWHGGEAEGAKERFRNSTPAQRQALITFLKSL